MLKNAFEVGADGGGRTHTLSRVLDFESSASANSATSATKELLFPDRWGATGLALFLIQNATDCEPVQPSSTENCCGAKYKNVHAKRKHPIPSFHCSAGKALLFPALRTSVRKNGHQTGTFLPSQEFRHGFRSCSHLKFFVNAPDVRVDCLVTDPEFLGDFLVNQSLAQTIEHFLFTRGKVSVGAFEATGFWND